jgi:hypothetical protein
MAHVPYELILSDLSGCVVHPSAGARQQRT